MKNNNVPDEFFKKNLGACGKVKDLTSVQLSIDEVANYCFQNNNGSCSLKMDIIHPKTAFLVYLQILLKGLNYVFGENDVVNLERIEYNDFQIFISNKMKNALGVYPYILNITDSYDDRYIKPLHSIKTVMDDGNLEDYGVILQLPTGKIAIKFSS